MRSKRTHGTVRMKCCPNFHKFEAETYRSVGAVLMPLHGNRQVVGPSKPTAEIVLVFGHGILRASSTVMCPAWIHWRDGVNLESWMHVAKRLLRCQAETRHESGVAPFSLLSVLSIVFRLHGGRSTLWTWQCPSCSAGSLHNHRLFISPTSANSHVSATGQSITEHFLK